MSEVARIADQLERAVHRRLNGEAVELTAAGDWPPVTGPGANAWNDTLRALHAAQRELREALKELPESRLAETVPGKDYSFYVLLHGAIQHDLYHAGQIGLLKRALRSK